MPSYVFNRSGSPPVNTKCCLGGLGNVPINSLSLCELTPERLPCLVECPRLLYYVLGLVLSLPAMYTLSVGNHAARHTLRILPLSLDSFRGGALPSGMRRLQVRACVCMLEESIS